MTSAPDTWPFHMVRERSTDDLAREHKERPAITVIIPTLNEGENLPGALASVDWVDEIVVVDSQSRDHTATIAKEAGVEVVQFYYSGYGPKKKNWALDNLVLRNEWVLLLDADERVTPALRREIEEAIGGTSADGYCIDREFVFMGRSLRCFRPNWNLRLFKHRLGRYEDLGLNDLPGTGDNEIHEHVALDGEIGFLENPLLHDDYRGLTRWIDRHNKYATWEAHLYRKFRAERIGTGLLEFLLLDSFSRKRVLRRLWVRLPLRPPIRFAVWYLLRRGFLDGRPGFIFCTLMAFYEVMINAKLYELERGDIS
jgi:glycosyltransferase involved in cell wall biosynthesis